MMRRAVVCFANVQEGRDPKILKELAAAASSVPGAWLIRMFADRTFHRSGLCIMGGSEAVGLAVFALVKTALSKIDLTSPERLQDATIHHHIGAVDLLPFHPVGDGTMADASATSAAVAQRIGVELGIPVLTYGGAHASGRGLAEVRKQTSFFRRHPGALAQHAVESQVLPDYGPRVVNQAHGITVCGASEYVLNYNIALESQDLRVGRHIAALIRASSPNGLPGVEAMAYIHSGPCSTISSTSSSTASPSSVAGSGSTALSSRCSLVEVACNLKMPSSLEGGPQGVLARVTELARLEGVGVLHSYCTNPLPEDLEALLRQPLGDGVGAAMTWECHVPPGEEAMHLESPE